MNNLKEIAYTNLISTTNLIVIQFYEEEPISIYIKGNQLNHLKPIKRFILSKN